MKKILSVLLAMLLVVTCLPLAASAEETSPNTSSWNFDKSTGVLTVSGTGTAERPANFFELDALENATKIVITDGITSIGSQAFMSCRNVSSVVMPDSITAIGNYAFTWCNKLSNVTLPKNVKTIGASAFAYTGITSLTIPQTVTSFGEDAFAFCASLSSVIISNGVTNLGTNTFQACDNLVSITIPKSVTVIGKSVFNLDGTSKIKGLKIHGYTGSYAETYAKENGIAFIPIDSTTPEPPVNPNPPITPDEPNTPDKPTPSTVFNDVPANAYYSEAVKWAVENGITSGTSKNTFSPNAPCTRAQAVTFLWRAAGKPEPARTGETFTDVKTNAYYEKAVQWAVEQGITSGTGNGKFSPDSTCTRAQIVTFLYRAEKSPTVTGGNSFSDVPATSYYKDAVAWAAKNEITSGTGGNQFSPENNCVRGQIVAFLYRFKVGPDEQGNSTSTPDDYFDWSSTEDNPDDNIDTDDQPGITNPDGVWTPPDGYYDDIDDEDFDTWLDYWD